MPQPAPPQTWSPQFPVTPAPTSPAPVETSPPTGQATPAISTPQPGEATSLATPRIPPTALHDRVPHPPPLVAPYTFPEDNSLDQAAIEMLQYMPDFTAPAPVTQRYDPSLYVDETDHEQLDDDDEDSDSISMQDTPTRASKSNMTNKSRAFLAGKRPGGPKRTTPSYKKARKDWRSPRAKRTTPMPLHGHVSGSMIGSQPLCQSILLCPSMTSHPTIQRLSGQRHSTQP